MRCMHMQTADVPLRGDSCTLAAPRHHDITTHHGAEGVGTALRARMSWLQKGSQA